jgi:hypothetical protein
LAGNTADDPEENEQKEQKRENIEQARLVVRSLFGARLPFLGIVSGDGTDDATILIWKEVMPALVGFGTFAASIQNGSSTLLISHFRKQRRGGVGLWKHVFVALARTALISTNCGVAFQALAFSTLSN